MNWKNSKTKCYNKYNWLKDFLDLLMESTASILQDCDNGLGSLWTVIREYIYNRIIT